MNGWVGRFVGPEQYKVRRMASAFGGFYALTSSDEQTSGLRLWRMHALSASPAIFSEIVDAEIQVVLNEPDDNQKTFDTVQLQGQGGADTLDALVVKADETTQVGTAIPFQGPKNGWYRANAMREDSVRARLRGTAALITIRFDMSANPKRRIFDSVLSRTRPSSKNY